MEISKANLGVISMKRKFLVDPTSNVVILIISTFLSIILSNVAPKKIDETSTKTQVFLYNIFVENTFSIIYLLIAIWLTWSLSYMFYRRVIQYQDERNLQLENNVNGLKKELKNEASLLLSRYSDLTKFKIKDILNENIKRFIDGKDIIHAAQLYKYSFITKDEITKVKVEFSGGYAKEGVDINAIMQSYYCIPTQMMEKVSAILSLYSYLLDNVDEDIADYVYEIYNSIDEIAESIITDITNLLNEHKNDFSDMDSDLYTVLTTTIKLLYEDDSDDEQNEDEAKIISEIFEDVNIDKELRNKKRTGILESILTKDYSVFQHEGENEKYGRAYISKCISLNGEKYTLLLTANSSIAKKHDWKKKLLNTCNELEDILKISFQEM